MIGRNRQTLARLVEHLSFFATTIGEAPYPELHARGARRQPAGRPQPGVSSPSSISRCRRRRISWSDDPVSFDSIYPHFFLAHEVAHQWWGQAVGWKNYHEQWLSEGLAQYFAALYAESDRGAGMFDDAARRHARVGGRAAVAGPDLARLPARPHPDRRPRVPRRRLQQVRGRAAHAAPADRRRGVLQRAADVLSRLAVQKAGTDDFRAAFEAVSRRSSSTRFFERWILGSTVPRAAPVSHQAEPSRGFGRDPRRAGRRRRSICPLTVAVQYTDGRSDDASPSRSPSRVGRGTRSR